jgi:hypothetical protein
VSITPGDYTPYSTVYPLYDQSHTKTGWAPESERDRLLSYETFDKIYWSNPTVFRLTMRGDDQKPLYIPNARTIVDTTSHYLLKGLSIGVKDPEKDKPLSIALTNFLDREAFYPKFHTNKVAGVTRGDWIFHMTADITKPIGTRVSISTVHPSYWFPVPDPENDERIAAIMLAKPFRDLTVGKDRIRRLKYTKLLVGQTTRIQTEEAIYEVENWWDDTKARKVKQINGPLLLDDRITCIPVYSLKNIDWQGDMFGASELRGIERVLGGVNQAISDQEMALALDGLGVYATDAGHPVDDQGNETDWEIGPAKVMEVPLGSYFRRVEGVHSVTPSMDHINYLEQKIFRGTGLTDVALGTADAMTLQSGIALAIKFMPTMAKLEQRDLYGLSRLKQMFHDWLTWQEVFEEKTLAKLPAPTDDPEEYDPELDPLDIGVGDKLPMDRTAKLNELNNMLDRKVISRAYYRREMTKMGYDIPEDIQNEIDEELQADQDRAVAQAEALAKANPQPAGAPPNNGTQGQRPNNSNNKGKPNESGGTEATQGAKRQARGGKPVPRGK